MKRAIRINWWFATIAVVAFFVATGCSIHPASMVIVNNNLQDRADIPKLNKDLYSSSNWEYGGQITENMSNQNYFRAKFHPSYFVNYWMVVEGEFGNGKTYPVVLDTGASPALFVNDIHIMENKLAICPLGSDDDAGWGVCQVPELRIGEMKLDNWLCFYRQQHTEIQVFGMPIVTGREIIAGLPTLQRFKYIAFDSVKKEVEFSLEKDFVCTQPDLWAKYPFEIEQGWGGNVFLMVKLPIAGEEIELQLDTGSGRGLAIAEQPWERISANIPKVNLSKGKDLYPYIGWLACKRGVIENLEVGDRMVKDAKISVFPNDNDLTEEDNGLLGMQYFQDTVMALDFERNLMWVKNTGGRQLSAAGL